MSNRQRLDRLLLNSDCNLRQGLLMPQGYAGLSNRRTRQLSVLNCGWSNAA